MRAWQPSDMAGVTGLEYFDSTKNVQVAGAAVTSWTAIRPGGGTANVATTVRDDYRPVVGQALGKQSVYFDTGTRRLALATASMPVGTANKFWFMASMILEARAGDFYPWGYGSNQGSGVTWKTRRGAVPSSDVGNNGYSIGTTPIAATGISIIVEAYREAGPLSRGWYNGQASPSTYAGTRPTSTARGAALGYWPEYGGGAEQHLLRLGYAYGEPTADDLRRLEGWLSWDTGDAGASLAAGHPYKAAAPMVDDGAPSGITGAALPALADVQSNGAAALKIVAAAALAVGAICIVADGRAPVAGRLTAALGDIVSEGAGGLRVAGTATVPLGDVACAATAALPLTAITGGRALAPITCVSAGITPSLASVSIALDPIGTISAARTDIRGTVAAVLNSVTSATDAGRAPGASATLAAALGAVGAEARSQARIAASVTDTLGAVQSAGLGAAEIRARVSQALGSISVHAHGASPGSGAASIVLDGVRSTAPAALRLTGATAGTLGPVVLGSHASEFNWAPTPAARTAAAPAQVRVAFTTRQVRLLYASKDNRMLIWPTKRVAEVLDYALDWSARIGDEAIVSSKATVRGDMVTIDRDRHDGKVQQVWLAGGVNGVGHVILQVTTDAGRVYEEAVQLSVAV